MSREKGKKERKSEKKEKSPKGGQKKGKAAKQVDIENRTKGESNGLKESELQVQFKRSVY